MTKAELLRRLAAEKARIDAALAKLTVEQCVLANTIGAWSVSDLLAHFVVHEQRALVELRSAVRGERPNIPMGDNDAFNLGAVLFSRAQPFQAVKATWDSSFDEMVRNVQSLDESDFQPSSRIVELLDDTIDGALANNSYEHYAEHRGDLDALIAKVDAP